MCGRYTLYTEEQAEEIRQIIDIAQRQVNGQLKLGEVFPSDRAPILVASQDKVVVRTAVWGFPGFRGKGLLINAKSETAGEKPMFRESLLTSRCVVPTTGFYEWNKQKEKFLFQYPDSTVVYLAGLWGEVGGKRRYTILTTEPNQAVAAVHNRMPVLLAKEQVRPWQMDTSAALVQKSPSQPHLHAVLAPPCRSFSPTFTH